MDVNGLLRLIRAGESERVEFKRSAGRDIHKDISALANAEGGHMVLGVDDKGAIVGTDARRDSVHITNSVQSVVPPPKISTHKVDVGGKEVLIVEVEKSEMLCSVGGVAYIRIGAGIRPLSIQEILVLSSEMGTVEWDRAPVSPLEDARKEHLDWFFRTMEESRGRRINARDRVRYLRSAGAARGDRLTNAGVLFFTDPTESISQSRVRLVYMIDGKPTGSKEYGGPLWKMIEDAHADIVRETGRSEVVISARRRRIGDYPSRALREALINAVAHRNYAIHADIRVFLHPDRIAIRSPGGLVPGADLDDPEHVPRNPSLCNLLYDSGFIERYGYGIVMMKEEVRKSPGLTLEFGLKPHSVEVTIKKDLKLGLDETDKRILDVLSHPMRSGEISKVIGTTKPTTLSRLGKLEQMGLVRKMGKGPQTRYGPQ